MSESRRGQNERKKIRVEGARVSSGDMTCLALRKWSKEGVRQWVGERDGGRRWETSHVQSHSPLGCTRQHTPSIIWLQLTHTQTDTHTHTYRVPPNGLLHSPFPYNPCLPALLLQLGYVSQAALAVANAITMTEKGQHIVCLEKQH